MQQNATAAGASPGPNWGAYSAPQAPGGFKGALLRRGERMEKGKG